MPVELKETGNAQSDLNIDFKFIISKISVSDKFFSLVNFDGKN